MSFKNLLEKLKSNKVIVFIILGLVTVATLETVEPRGYAIWILFIPLISLVRLTKRPSLPIILAAACSLFLFFDFFVTEAQLISSISFGRRIVGTIALFAVAFNVRRIILGEAKLMQLSHDKDRIMSLVAHDLRNPIGAIISWVEFIKAERTSVEEIKNDLSLIERSSRLALDITEDIQNFSNLEDKSFQTKFIKLNISQLLAEVFSICQAVANKKAIQIAIHHPEKTLFVDGDKMLLHRAFQNLIDNAVKYSQKGSKVEVDVGASKEGLEIAIKDNGPGISDDEQKRLFEPFYRTSNKPTAGESSTGLGLASVAKIIDKHKGKVLVQSIKGSGSTFTVILPRNSELEGT